MTDQQLTRTEAIELAGNAALRLAVILDQYGDIIDSVRAEIVFENDVTMNRGNFVVMYAHYIPDLNRFVNAEVDEDEADDARRGLRNMPLFEDAFDRDDVGDHVDLLVRRCEAVRALLEASSNVPS